MFLFIVRTLFRFKSSSFRVKKLANSKNGISIEPSRTQGKSERERGLGFRRTGTSGIWRLTERSIRGGEGSVSLPPTLPLSQASLPSLWDVVVVISVSIVVNLFQSCCYSHTVYLVSRNIPICQQHWITNQKIIFPASTVAGFYSFVPRVWSASAVRVFFVSCFSWRRALPIGLLHASYIIFPSPVNF